MKGSGVRVPLKAPKKKTFHNGRSFCVIQPTRTPAPKASLFKGRSGGIVYINFAKQRFGGSSPPQGSQEKDFPQREVFLCYTTYSNLRHQRPPFSKGGREGLSISISRSNASGVRVPLKAPRKKTFHNGRSFCVIQPARSHDPKGQNKYRPRSDGLRRFIIPTLP